LRRGRAMIEQGFNVRETATRLKIGKTALYAALAGTRGDQAGGADFAKRITALPCPASGL
jgi:hypothetical protein